MGRKDLSQKYLLEKDDVFADIINVLLGKGEKLVDARYLESKKTDSVYYDGERDELKEMHRDICKKNTEDGQSYVIWGIENQDKIDYSMPLRCMGYDYISYKNQKDQILAQRSLESKNNSKNAMFRKDDKLVPVITLVLNYNKKWDAPLSLREMLNIPEVVRKYDLAVPDYKINLISLGSLEPEVLEQFTSDFQIIAAQVRYQEEPKKLREFYQQHQKPIVHRLEVQKAIAAISNEPRYMEFELEKEGSGTMCQLFDMVLNEGISRGINQGIEQERKESVIRTISILRSLNHGDSDIKNALKCNYKIGDEEVNRYLGRTENRDV